MDLVYAASDIVSRAGASSVSELSIVETSDFIPSPNVAEDHQTKNAKSIVDKKGLLLKESELTEFSLVLKRY
jgi:UDP-N-acetylglucosamine--N-acetylmuramyl-(pentapeptide) pyrophosphoryl-undecaprenol N-acetylglucosamine transferase